MKLEKKKAKATTEFEDSKGNVFADLGLESPGQLLAKSTLTIDIRRAMEERGLTEAAAAKLLNVDRGDLASALRGDLHRFSFEELNGFLKTVENWSNGEATKMRKVPLSDGSGNWFDLDSAKAWKERLPHHEQEWRDRHEPHGETLYYSAKGSFILGRWHHYLGETFLPLDPEKAVRWLIANEYQKEVQQLEFQSEERKLEV